MVMPRFGGAQVPRVPGSSPTGAALPGRPNTSGPRFATGYLQNIYDKGYRSRTMAYLASGGKEGEGFVYTGEGKGQETRFSRMAGPEYRLATPKHKAINDAMGEFEYWSTEKKKSMAKQLYMAGFLTSPDANLMDLQEGYGNLLASAAARYAQGQMITPEQLLEHNIRYNLAAVGVDVKGKLSAKSADNWFTKLQHADSKSSFVSGAKKLLPAGSTDLSHTEVTHQTSKNVDIYSAEDAKGLIRATLRRELDRDPTQQEFEDFVSALQTKQRNDPSTTHTTTTSVYGEDGRLTDQSSSSKTTGGLTAQGADEFATEQAQANPHWAEWQAVGTYFPALLQSLSSAVPGT